VHAGRLRDTYAMKANIRRADGTLIRDVAVKVRVCVCVYVCVCVCVVSDGTLIRDVAVKVHHYCYSLKP
jgi:hypothetical protein